MKKANSVLAWVTAATLILSLAACGGNSSAPDTNPGNTAPSGEAPATPTVGDAVLRVITPFDTNVIGEEYLTALETAAAQVGVRLEAENIDSETYKTKIKVSLAGNELPDVFFTWGDSYTVPFIEAGALLPLNDAITGSGYDFVESYVIPYSDGNIYTAPYTANDYFTCYYNKTVLEQLGQQPPKSWEDLLAIVDAANAQGIAAWGIANGARWQGDLLYNELVLREDPKAYENAMAEGGSFTAEPFLEAAKKVKILVDRGAFQKGYMQAAEQEMSELFYADQIAMHTIGSWAFAPFIENMGDNLGYFQFPKTGGDENYTSSETVMFGALPNGLCVSAGTAFPGEAAEFVTTYSKHINDAMVQKGRLGFIKTDVTPDTALHPAYEEFTQVAGNVASIQPWWYGITDASIGEPLRDLSHELFGGDITPEDFVVALDKIMKP